MRDSLPGFLDTKSSLERPLKLLIDENIGIPIGNHIAGIMGFRSHLTPIVDFVVKRFGAGTKDQVWIPKIAGEGWIILSSDRAKRSGGPKLPMICSAYRVTHLLLSTALHEKKQFEKAIIILKMWDEIEKLKDAPAGSRHHLLIRNRRMVVAPFVRKTNHTQYPPDTPLRFETT